LGCGSCFRGSLRRGIPVLLIDDATGSEWNFQGCATSGKAKGYCLDWIPMLKDYWFDWRNHNPATTVYGKSKRIQ